MTDHPTSFDLSHWSLADLFLFPDGPEIESAFKDLETKIYAFEAYRVRLSDSLSPAEFNQALQQIEAIYRIAYRLNAYAGLWFSEDTQNQSAQTLMARVDQTIASMTNRTLFFSLWWKSVDETQASRLMSGSGDVRYWLEQTRNFKKYTLNESEEKIINIKDLTGSRALDTLYQSITNRYTFKLELDGHMQELTRGDLMVYVRHHDPDLRSRAYRELYRVYEHEAPILGQIYQFLVRDWHNENIDLRKFDHAMMPRNLSNDIPGEVIDILLDVCQQNAPLFQRFFRLKARLLGVPRLRRYDIYAPLGKSEKQYTFNQAVERVMEAFNRFDPTLAALARQVLADGHVDSEVRKGKRGGAFCWTALPDLTPWVLLNYQGRPDDVATMAHELGHAIHSQLAAHHSLLTLHPSLPLAETASTFGEMMLIDHLLAHESDDQVRRDLLFHQVDDAYATIIRQAFFALFERRAHQMIHDGASIDELAQAYQENLAAQFGDAVEIGDEFRWEWVSIPHIFSTPFYVYAYAFGQLLVLSLYQQYIAEGETFKPRYLSILAAGGSMAPVELLAQAGIDIRQASFWQGGFDVIRGLVEKLEGLPLDQAK
jgi:oligoendopeptidase F